MRFCHTALRLHVYDNKDPSQAMLQNKFKRQEFQRHEDPWTNFSGALRHFLSNCQIDTSPHSHTRSTTSPASLAD